MQLPVSVVAASDVSVRPTLGLVYLFSTFWSNWDSRPRSLTGAGRRSPVGTGTLEERDRKRKLYEAPDPDAGASWAWAVFPLQYLDMVGRFLGDVNISIFFQGD